MTRANSWGSEPQKEEELIEVVIKEIVDTYKENPDAHDLSELIEDHVQDNGWDNEVRDDILDRVKKELR